MSSESDTGLTPEQSRDLRRIAGIMIPASDAFAVPGADDADIVNDMLRSLGRDLHAIRSALTQLAALSGGSFTDLAADRQEAVAQSFLSTQTPDVVVLGRLVLQCYYRDDRVVRALGLEPRAPFPLGHKLEQGDWSLLDAVRSRPRMWRDVP